MSKINDDRKRTPLRLNTNKDLVKNGMKNGEEIFKRNPSKININENKSSTNLRNLSRNTKKNEKDNSQDNKPRK